MSDHHMTLCVFCGSSSGRQPVYVDAARTLGEELARRGHSLVYGGGGTGLMGRVANAVLAGGGKVTGVIPQSMTRVELEHTGLTELKIVHSMHERKATMARLADAFIALPGGMGTFEELLETLTWAQLGIHGKAVGLLDVDGYYDPLLDLLDHAVEEGFMGADQRALLIHSAEIDELLDAIESYRPTTAPLAKLDWDQI